MKRVIVYSHGFGVRKDSRGMFTDIASALPDVEHVMFDYNTIDDEQNTIVVAPFAEQAEKLSKVLQETRTLNPDSQINLICHSQGCVAASMLNPGGIVKTIFIAPPSEINTERMLEIFGNREGSVVNMDGISAFPRRDGSTTIVPRDYWYSIQNVDPIALYNAFSRRTSLCVITADQDEILGQADLGGLSSEISIVHLPGNHDFSGEDRHGLIVAIDKALKN